MILLTIIFSFLKAIFLADFISGIGHWLEDRYANESMTWIAETVVKPNIEHHHTPRSFLQRSYWQRNDVSILLSAFVGLTIGLFAHLNLTIILTLLLLSQINEVHAFAHLSIHDTPTWVLKLQKIGILQSKKHHNLHHSRPFENRYCILTNYLNPVLDYTMFFRKLEHIIFLTFRVSPNR